MLQVLTIIFIFHKQTRLVAFELHQNNNTHLLYQKENSLQETKTDFINSIYFQVITYLVPTHKSKISTHSMLPFETTGFILRGKKHGLDLDRLKRKGMFLRARIVQSYD